MATDRSRDGGKKKESPGTRKPGGGTLKRNQTVGVRLDDKLRYFAELAARKQHRTLSSYIEWAIRESLASVPLGHAAGDNGNRTMATEAEDLWDTDPAERFALLAMRYPDLLSHHEQIIWSLVKRNPYFWITRYKSEAVPGRMDHTRLRKTWSDLEAVARKEKPESILPQNEA